MAVKASLCQRKALCWMERKRWAVCVECVCVQCKCGGVCTYLSLHECSWKCSRCPVVCAVLRFLSMCAFTPGHTASPSSLAPYNPSFTAPPQPRPSPSPLAHTLVRSRGWHTQPHLPHSALHAILDGVVQAFYYSNPDCTSHTAITHVITVLERWSLAWYLVKWSLT